MCSRERESVLERERECVLERESVLKREREREGGESEWREMA